MFGTDRKSVRALSLSLVAGGGIALMSPAALGQQMVAQADPGVVAFSDFNLIAARADAELARTADGMTRFAVPRDVSITPHDSGEVRDLGDGRVAWTLTIDGGNAVNVNIGTFFDVPASARVYVYDSQGRQAHRVLTAADNADHGEFWFPPIGGSSLQLYVEVDEAEFGAFADGFEVQRIGLGFAGLGDVGAGDPAQLEGGDVPLMQATTLTCQIDVACSQADPWRDQVDSVVAYAANGFLTCSGALVNNTAQDETPYILTAWHCLNGGAGINFNSVVTSFNFQNSTCRTPGTPAAGAGGNDNFNQQTVSGAQFRMSHNESDVLLYEMNSVPPASYGAKYIGWNRSSAAPGPGVGIHHPGVEEKRISVENGNPFATSWTLGISGQPVIFGFRTDYDEGVLEGGSSGSPYFDANGRIRGVASGVGGGFNCFSQTQVYGGFDDAWNGGGTPSTRLRDWLDPVNQNPIFLDQLDLQNAPPSPFDLVGPADSATGVIEPVTFTWEDSANADDYRLTIFELPSFALAFDQNVGSSESFQLPVGVLSSNTSYNWSVTANNVNGSTLADSDFTFTTGAFAPLAFDLLTPANGAVDVAQPVTFTWEDSPNATNYRLLVLDAGTFASVLDQSVGNVTSFEVAPGSFDDGTEYLWNVQAQSAGGNRFAASDFTFTTETVSIVCPGDATGDGQVTALDVSAVLSAFGSSDPDADVNDDGSVTALDISLVLSNFGTVCQ